jgi:hypothetical protein
MNVETSFIVARSEELHMVRSVGLLFFAATFVGALGCRPTTPSGTGSKPAGAAAVPGGDNRVNNLNNNIVIISHGRNNVVNTWDGKASVNGITFEVRGSRSAQFQIDDGDVSIKRGTSRLGFKDGRVSANGKDAGAAKKGDVVVLEENGNVMVNGEKR